ncbi:Hypothetical protein A7982_01254 [Minicystis rosea]|nr:Hypothetical protein A7982_01254 [Minicystis rosea]
MKTVDELLEVLARGEMTDLEAAVYGGDSLSPEQLEVPTRLLGDLRAPPGDHFFKIVERHTKGRFELVILDVPWKRVPDRRGSGYHPLLVTREPEVRVIGFVMPWNEIMDRLPPDGGVLGELSAQWILWTMGVQAAH